MKHLKTYENLEDELELYDYVICEEVVNFSDDIDAVDFVNSHIGQLVYINYNYNFCYKVAFDNIPIELDNKFNIHFIMDKAYMIRPMERSEIKYWSKNKEDLEHIITAKKYNL